jgi:hypothetical protein
MGIAGKNSEPLIPKPTRRSLVARHLLHEGKIRTLGVISALGFPSKTSTEIAPDHRKLSDRTSRLNRDGRAQTRINIALCKYWWYFRDALGNGGNRFPLPAPIRPLRCLTSAFPHCTGVLLCRRAVLQESLLRRYVALPARNPVSTRRRQFYCLVRLSEAVSVAGPRIILLDVMSAVPVPRQNSVRL